MYEFEAIKNVYDTQLFDLINKAHEIKIKNFPLDMEICQLVSVKTGGCTEDCGYCAQSNYHSSEIKLNALLPVAEVERQAKLASENGVQRMCLGAAYRSPSKSTISRACEYIKVIKKYNLETCVTLGMLNKEDATLLKEAGLDYYNHNIDTSEEYYPNVVTTHTFQDRINTINNVGMAGLKVCCGGIIGMGESKEDRINFIKALSNLPYVPDSIPINLLSKIKGTKFENIEDIDKIELVRVIATSRILFPTSRIRLSAGRVNLTELEQAMCFMAGANSIFVGDKLLTTVNNKQNNDAKLLTKLSLNKDNRFLNIAN